MVAFIECNTIKWPILTFFGYCFVTLMLFFFGFNGCFSPLNAQVWPLLHHAGCHTALLNVLSAITASQLATIYTLHIHRVYIPPFYEPSSPSLTVESFPLFFFCVFILGGCGLPFLTNTHGSLGLCCSDCCTGGRCFFSRGLLRNRRVT